MGESREHDEEVLGALLSELREPPAEWIRVAQQAPAARAELERIVKRAEADEDYRKIVLEDIEKALREDNLAPEPQRVAALRVRLDESGKS